MSSTCFQITAKKAYLQKFTKEYGAGGQVLLMCSFETFLTDTAPGMRKELPMTLKVLYEEDIVEEDSLSKWFDDAAAAKKFGVGAKDAAAVRKAAASFIEWLRTADEDDEDDE